MQLDYRINNLDIVYLIHGQPYEINYRISRCLFVLLITYNGPKWWNIKLHLKKHTSSFSGLTNAYKPYINFWKFGLGIGLEKLKLNINFFNVVRPDTNVNIFFEKKTTPTKFKITPFDIKQINTAPLFPRVKIKSPILKINTQQLKKQ